MTEIPEITSWAQPAPSVNFRVEVTDGRAEIQVTATTEDDQIIYVHVGADAAELRSLSRMAAEAAEHVERES